MNNHDNNPKYIQIRGARVHNLKNINVDIPLASQVCPAPGSRRWRWGCCMRRDPGGIWNRFLLIREDV